MRYKLLGNTGLRVSEICLGTMTFGEEWGWGADKTESRKIFDVFVEAGGNFIDTANRYTEGTSERYVGEFIASDREYFVVATKYTLYNRLNDPNAAGNHRKNLVQSLEASLKRLNTEYVDLLWVHAWDFLTPVEEVMRGLDDLVRAGKVLYVGVSDTPAWIVAQANTLARERGWTPFCALQIEYSLIERTPERELLPMARAFDMAVTPWAPVGAGILTGKYTGKGKADQPRRIQEGSPRLSERNLRIAEEVVKIAEELGYTPAQVAINWVRQQPGVMIPILGARRAEQLKENLLCLERPLPEAVMQQLDEISRVDLGFPHEFLAKDYIRKLVYAGMYDRIDRRNRLA
ncbi:MAG: aldo/keto reductase [Calditrichaeota bacterium]|nr:MAG: aldo/keto reductase [Calditrichota bacterium]